MDTAPLAPRAGVDWGAAAALNRDAVTECGSASNPADDADKLAWGAAANAASDMSMKSMREMLSIALASTFFRAPTPAQGRSLDCFRTNQQCCMKNHNQHMRGHNCEVRAN